MLIFQLVCLMIMYFVLQKYISDGIYSKKHRLLPVLFVLVVLYNFYQIFQNMMKEYILFAELEDILIIQILCVLIYYVTDLFDIRRKRWANILMFVGLVIVDYMMINAEYGSLSYYSVFIFAVLACIAIIAGLAIYANTVHTYSRKERHANAYLFLAIFIPAIMLCVSPFASSLSEILPLLGFVAMDLIIFQLMISGQLVDTMTLMRENLFDLSDVAVLLFDDDFCYMGASNAAEEMLSRELKKISKYSNYYKGADRLRVLAERASEYREVVLGNRFYSYKLTPIMYREKIHGYALTLIDITQQKVETQCMEKLKKEAEEQTLIKSNFLARMTHELRSPLHAIISLSDILMENKEISQRNRSLLMHVKNAGKTLSELVNSILLFSKLENGKLKFMERYYDMEKLIEELSYISIVNLKDKPVSFRAEFINQHPKYLIGDDIRVREMIQNLLSNAVKFTEKGEIRCELFFSCCENEMVKVTCRVTDTGQGMKPDEMNKIFHEYVSFAGNKQLEGTGLGLSIVKQLAELMGGSASVKSNLAGGSEFEISFYQKCKRTEQKPPKVYTKESLFKQSMTAWGHATKPTWTYSKGRVMVADDMQVNLVIFKELAKAWQFQIDIAENGTRALQLAMANDYDMIFLDLLMPDIGGDEVAEKISAKKDIPLVLLTANLTDDLKEQYTKYGFKEFLSKPLDGTKLKEIIERNMPEEYRENYVSEDTGFDGTAEIYRQAAESFVREVKPLMNKLSSYLPDDLDLFRIKVHGIKGASRQIGKMNLSENAEVMEMAAKTENLEYIERHMEDFLECLQRNLLDIEDELAMYPDEHKQAEEQELTVPELFNQIKAGFDEYNLDMIEEALDALATAELDKEENSLMDELKEAYLDLEYEKGSEVAERAIEYVRGKV